MNLIERYRIELEQICAKHRLLLDDEVLTPCRKKYIQKGRSECYLYLYKRGFRDTDIWKAFNFHRTAILASLRKHYPEELKRK